MFDIRLSDEQREFQKLARDFAQNEIKPVSFALDQEPNWEKRVPIDLLKKGSQLDRRLRGEAARGHGPDSGWRQALPCRGRFEGPRAPPDVEDRTPRRRQRRDFL